MTYEILYIYIYAITVYIYISISFYIRVCVWQDTSTHTYDDEIGPLR